jgi:NitT/TauT family transport system substrate-binding protein
MRSRQLWLSVLFALITSLMRSGPLSADDTRVTIGYASTAMSLVTAPWLAAYELGFFKEQGIDLHWIVLNGGANAIQQTLNKSVDITYPSANELLVIGKQEGREALPIRFFYLGMPRNIWQLAVVDESPIKSLSDLRGAKIGIFANQAAYLPQIRALVRSAGLDPTKDIQLRVVGVGAGALQALRGKQIDVSVQGEVQHAAFETMGASLRRLPTIPLVEQLHGPGFLTHENNLRDPARRDVMLKVARAMAMGTLYCQTSAERCVRLAWKAVPTLRPPGDDSNAIASAVHVMESVLADMALRPEQQGQYGRYLSTSWDAYIKLLHDGGEISGAVDPSSLYTNVLIEEANRFDHARVTALAKEAAQ